MSNPSASEKAFRRRLQCSRLSKISPVQGGRSHAGGKALTIRSITVRRCFAHPGLTCQAIAEDRYVENSEKSQYHECVYEPATARSFRSIRYYYYANANRKPYAI